MAPRSHRRLVKVVRVGLATAGLAGLVACAGAAAEQPPAEEGKRRPAGPAMVVEGETGGLNQHDVESAFLSLHPKVERCIAQGMERIGALGGTFKVTMRIAPDGTAHSVFLSESTLGDRDTESCILDQIRAKSWPEPLGGDGIAEHEFAVDAQEPAAALDSDDFRPAMRFIRRKVHPCLRRVRGRFVATLYISRSGQVRAAGIAPPSPEGEEQADCVAEALRKFNFGRQRSRLSKVTFAVP